QNEEKINQQKIYWQNQLNNLLDRQNQVINDPSQIKIFQQSLNPKQFTNDEDGVIQKEIWSNQKNQSLIENACQELQKYYDAFQELDQILTSEGNDYEELEDIKGKLKEWLDSPFITRKNAVASRNSRLVDKIADIEKKIEFLQRTAVEPTNQSFAKKLNNLGIKAKKIRRGGPKQSKQTVKIRKKLNKPNNHKGEKKLTPSIKVVRVAEPKIIIKEKEPD
ncbi:7950_t:CDS:1, partial [Cetraspora pellucida]